MNAKEGESKLDERLGAFELCSYTMDTYPDEKITFIKFLDDNDPSLILIVTYDEASSTSYMKVMKIEQVANKEKNEKLDNKSQTTVDELLQNQRSNLESQATFSNIEVAPITNLK